MAGSYLVSFGGYGLGLWFGSYVMVDLKNVKYNAGNILIIIWLVLTVGQYISQLGPCLKKISQGRMTAARIFAVCDRKPLI